MLTLEIGTLKRDGTRVLSTSAVAKFTGVAARTVCMWIDSGKLKGFRLPASKHRRVIEADLFAFCEAWGMEHLIR